MAIKLTTAAINKLAIGQGAHDLFNNGILCIFSGNQPTDPDSAVTDTLLITYTTTGLPYTNASSAMGQIAIGGSATGSIDTITVGGMDENLLGSSVSFSATADTTAQDIADNINAEKNILNITAVASTSYVNLYCPAKNGALANNLTFATTVSGSLTATPSGIFSSGVSAVNGLQFVETSSDGVISKKSDIWQGTAIVSGTGGWFRFIGPGSDKDGSGVTEVRFDGTVGTSNADLIVGSTNYVDQSIYVLNNGSITMSAE